MGRGMAMEGIANRSGKEVNHPDILPDDTFIQVDDYLLMPENIESRHTLPFFQTRCPTLDHRAMTQPQICKSSAYDDLMARLLFRAKPLPPLSVSLYSSI
jgi:hypothetical protein